MITYMTKATAIVLACAAMNAGATSYAQFWDTSGFQFDSTASQLDPSTDWNKWLSVSDGLGGSIGIRYSVSPGFTTWDWDSYSGKAPHGSVNDPYVGSKSFGRGDLAGIETDGVNGIRAQLNKKTLAPRNNYVVELDFSQYLGSFAGGVDGLAGPNTFIGVSDIYTGSRYGKTTVTLSGTLADGRVTDARNWTLYNGGAVDTFGPNNNNPKGQLQLKDSVISGNGLYGVGAGPGDDRLDSVLALVQLDSVGYKSVKLQFDTYPVGGNSLPRIDNHAIYAGTFMSGPPPVPEPSSALLLAVGLLALTSVARRQQAASPA